MAAEDTYLNMDKKLREKVFVCLFFNIRIRMKGA